MITIWWSVSWLPFDDLYHDDQYYGDQYHDDLYHDTQYHDDGDQYHGDQYHDDVYHEDEDKCHDDQYHDYHLMIMRRSYWISVALEALKREKWLECIRQLIRVQFDYHLRALLLKISQISERFKWQHCLKCFRSKLINKWGLHFWRWECWDLPK